MQLANAIPEPAAALLGLLDDPQAAIARTQLTPASPHMRRLGIELVLAKHA